MINPVRYDRTRPLVSVDTETCLFTYSEMAPKVVCYSFAWRDESGEIHTALADKEAGSREFADLMQKAIEGKITLP